MTRILIFIFAMTAALAGCSDNQRTTGCADLKIENAWIREAPNGVAVLAGYMQLSNPADTSITVVSATSPMFERIEFHQSLNEDGQMKMQSLPVLQVPAKGQLDLEQGGRHMMLFEPQKSLKDGDSLSLVLGCASRDEKQTQIEVKRVMGNDSSHHHH